MKLFPILHHRWCLFAMILVMLCAQRIAFAQGMQRPSGGRKPPATNAKLITPINYSALPSNVGFQPSIYSPKPYAPVPHRAVVPVARSRPPAPITKMPIAQPAPPPVGIASRVAQSRPAIKYPQGKQSVFQSIASLVETPAPGTATSPSKPPPQVFSRVPKLTEGPTEDTLVLTFDDKRMVINRTPKGLAFESSTAVPLETVALGTWVLSKIAPQLKVAPPQYLDF